MVLSNEVADLQYACALYLKEKESDPRPYDMARALVGGRLCDFFEGADRAIETTSRVHNFIQGQRHDSLIGINGENILHSFGDVKFLPPLSEIMPKVLCAGANFQDHVAKAQSQVSRPGNAGGRAPGAFFKAVSNIVGNNDPIPYPSRTRRLDYEGEIGLVIGKQCIDVSRSKFLDYVVGYTLFNDISIRDTGKSYVEKGWRENLEFNPSKNFDGGGALGPWITLKDEIPDPNDIPIVTKVNGEVRQNGSTKMMIRGYGEYLEMLSVDMHFYPGDIITTGTCSGTAMDSSPRDASGVQDPKLFLKVGDLIEVSSPGLGELRNKVIPRN